MFVLARDGSYETSCKLDMFTFVLLLLHHRQCVPCYFLCRLWGGGWGGGGSVTEFWLFGGGTQKRRGNFKSGDQTRIKLWYRCKGVLINT